MQSYNSEQKSTIGTTANNVTQTTTMGTNQSATPPTAPPDEWQYISTRLEPKIFLFQADNNYICSQLNNGEISFFFASQTIFPKNVAPEDIFNYTKFGANNWQPITPKKFPTTYNAPINSYQDLISLSESNINESKQNKTTDAEFNSAINKNIFELTTIDGVQTEEKTQNSHLTIERNEGGGGIIKIRSTIYMVGIDSPIAWKKFKENPDLIQTLEEEINRKFSGASGIDKLGKKWALDIQFNYEFVETIDGLADVVESSFSDNRNKSTSLEQGNFKHFSPKSPNNVMYIHRDYSNHVQKTAKSQMPVGFLNSTTLGGTRQNNGQWEIPMNKLDTIAEETAHAALGLKDHYWEYFENIHDNSTSLGFAPMEEFEENDITSGPTGSNKKFTNSSAQILINAYEAFLNGDLLGKETAIVTGEDIPIPSRSISIPFVNKNIDPTTANKRKQATRGEFNNIPNNVPRW